MVGEQHGEMTKTAAWMSWSSGKDSAFALRAARADPSIDVQGLLVTVNAEADRVAIARGAAHVAGGAGGTARAATSRRRDPVSLPQRRVRGTRWRPRSCHRARRGIERMVFGDLFLQDVREYRERNLAGTGITPMFPLWGRPTDAVGPRA